MTTFQIIGWLILVTLFGGITSYTAIYVGWRQALAFWGVIVFLTASLLLSTAIIFGGYP